jgi:hypothetical protein
VIDFHGKPFSTWDEYCRASKPFGLELSDKGLERIVADCTANKLGQVDSGDLAW